MRGEKRVDESLDAVGMIESRRKAPHHLSGGQKKEWLLPVFWP
jgi:ABC-type cobalt transport system, ATPase component